MSNVESQVTDGVAVLRMDNPPVNSLGLDLRRELLAGLSRAEADASVGAIVIIGSGKGFSGGADIREFGTPRSMAQPNLPRCCAPSRTAPSRSWRRSTASAWAGASSSRSPATTGSPSRVRDWRCRK